MIDALLCLCIRADDGTAFERIEDFCGVKTQNRQIAVSQDTAGRQANAERMRRVIDDFQIVDVSDLLQSHYIAGIAVAVDRHDSSGMWSYSRLNLGRVQIQRLWIDINENRTNAIP